MVRLGCYQLTLQRLRKAKQISLCLNDERCMKAGGNGTHPHVLQVVGEYIIREGGLYIHVLILTPQVSDAGISHLPAFSH